MIERVTTETILQEARDYPELGGQHTWIRADLFDRVVGPEQCLCAAIQMPDGYVIRGHRHDDCILCSSGIERYKDAGLKTLGPKMVQGFLTNYGRFVDRQEGMFVQKLAGKKSAYSFDGELHGDMLFSEDLYS